MILSPFILVAVMLTALSTVAQDDPKIKAQITSAMSAAPLSIAKDATMMGWPAKAGDAPTVLNKGTNEWTCFPDNPSSPGNDPACYDKTWMAWIKAKGAKTDPKITVPGFAYMLGGGSTASNTDPFATLPLTSDQWQTDPPHVMIILPEKWDPTDFQTTMASGGPYVMWAGTPYEHLMMPVTDMQGM
jgi:hypothetical protein